MSELIAMAMAYRNWSQRELAEFLGRDVHNLIPPSGIPKVDVVIRLAEALDWPAAAVLEDICGTSSPRVAQQPTPQASDFAQIVRDSYGAWMDGEFARSVQLALKAAELASTDGERAEADRREAVAWDYLGRYVNAVEAAQRGLARSLVPLALRIELRSNLASSYFALGRVHEAQGIVESLLAELKELDLGQDLREGVEAHARFVRAQCSLHRVDAENDRAFALAKAAWVDFRNSGQMWRSFVARTGMESFLGRAQMCDAGELAASAVLGEIEISVAMRRFEEELARAVDVSRIPRGDLLEAVGWWAVLGATVALRSELPPVARERHLAVFANKAFEVADASGNWLLRERAFVIDFMRSRSELPRGRSVMDNEDLRNLAGAMGRFPMFRPKGWEILREAIRI